MSNKKTFSKEFLINELGLPDDPDPDKVEVLLNEILSTNRWSSYNEIVFKFDGVLYRAYYGQGLTENQHESPWDYENDVKCEVVEPVTVEKVVYRQIQTQGETSE